MQITITRRTIVAAVAAMALVGAGGAIAASNAAGGSSGTAATAACGPGPGGHGARAGFLDAAATYLGLTQAELRTAHQNGTTLAQLAAQKGKSVDGLKQAIYDASESAPGCRRDSRSHHRSTGDDDARRSPVAPGRHRERNRSALRAAAGGVAPPSGPRPAPRVLTGQARGTGAATLGSWPLPSSVMTSSSWTWSRWRSAATASPG